MTREPFDTPAARAAQGERKLTRWVIRKNSVRAEPVEAGTGFSPANRAFQDHLASGGAGAAEQRHQLRVVGNAGDVLTLADVAHWRTAGTVSNAGATHRLQSPQRCGADPDRWCPGSLAHRRNRQRRAGRRLSPLLRCQRHRWPGPGAVCHAQRRAAAEQPRLRGNLSRPIACRAPRLALPRPGRLGHRRGEAGQGGR
jgi:hypothetical protein